MAHLPPGPPPPIALPPTPHDPTVTLPAVPTFPPSVGDVLEAVKSIDETRPGVGVQCTDNDLYNSVLYEHGVVAQAVAAIAPQGVVPAWFQGVIQQLRMDLQNDIQQLRTDLQNDMRNMMQEVLPDLKRVTNRWRIDGHVVPFEIVPFNDGTNPTQPPNNLPPLHSNNAIENLSGANLTQYGIVPLPVDANPLATSRLRKDTLKRVIGALG